MLKITEYFSWGFRKNKAANNLKNATGAEKSGLV